MYRLYCLLHFEHQLWFRRLGPSTVIICGLLTIMAILFGIDNVIPTKDEMRAYLLKVQFHSVLKLFQVDPQRAYLADVRELLFISPELRDLSVVRAIAITVGAIDSSVSLSVIVAIFMLLRNRGHRLSKSTIRKQRALVVSLLLQVLLHLEFSQFAGNRTLFVHHSSNGSHRRLLVY